MRPGTCGTFLCRGVRVEHTFANRGGRGCCGTVSEQAHEQEDSMTALRAVKSEESRAARAKVPVPEDSDKLRERADKAAGLHSATGWELAAYVFAWTEDTGRGGAPRTSVNFFTLGGFAELGIRGLTSRPSVTKYRRAWQAAIDAGLAVAVSPGDEAELPDAAFSDFTGTPEKQNSVSADREQNQPVSHSQLESKPQEQDETQPTNPDSGVDQTQGPGVSSDETEQTNSNQKSGKPDRNSEDDIKRRVMEAQEHLISATQSLTKMQWLIGESDHMRQVVYDLLQEHIEETTQLQKEV